MSQWPVQVWGALIAAVGALAGIIGNRAGTRADAASTLTDGALRVVEQLQEEVVRHREWSHGLEKRLSSLEVAQREERDWCDMRIGQLVSALHTEGIDVPPAPPRNPPPSL